jgi:D-arabinose 1-dehydrogenase-like Zn-dependent alcohol dehydrogenase
MANVENGTGTIALAAFDANAALSKHEIGRPAPGPTDVQIDIKYCGMCHSDLHGKFTFGVFLA